MQRAVDDDQRRGLRKSEQCAPIRLFLVDLKRVQLAAPPAGAGFDDATLLVDGLDQIDDVHQRVSALDQAIGCLEFYRKALKAFDPVTVELVDEELVEERKNTADDNAPKLAAVRGHLEAKWARVRSLHAAVPIFDVETWAAGDVCLVRDSRILLKDVVAHSTNLSARPHVDNVPAADLLQIRRALPAVKLVQVIHVLDDSSIDEATAVAPLVDIVLLDSGNPNADTKQLGGTGRTHNWAISRKIAERLENPVILAGGLTAENISQAIESAKPWGVDLCNGVRTADVLDRAKLTAFAAALRTAPSGRSDSPGK